MSGERVTIRGVIVGIASVGGPDNFHALHLRTDGPAPRTVTVALVSRDIHDLLMVHFSGQAVSITGTAYWDLVYLESFSTDHPGSEGDP